MFPVQSPPVRRPEVMVPSAAVNVSAGSVEELVAVYMHLTHGANYDDPSPWQAAAFTPRNVNR